VTLGLNNIFVGRVMEKCIPDFASAHGGVDLMLRMGSQDELEAAILDGTMDLALTWLPAESREIEMTILFDDELVVVSGKDHPLGKLREVTLQQVEPFPLALPGRVGNIRRLFDVACAKQKVSPRVSLGIDDTAARLSFVEAGHAATVAPRSAVANRPSLRISRIVHADVRLSAGLLTNKGAQLASGARRLFDELRASFPESTSSYESD
jgi:DNA-binding transcriptional LysR family regulator